MSFRKDHPILYQLSFASRASERTFAGRYVSRTAVSGITERSHTGPKNKRGAHMPILIIALLALGAWLAIGVLLGSAVLLEQHNKNKHAH
jgi:hypothetical protein